MLKELANSMAGSVQKMVQEEWKTYRACKGAYEVSNLGNVRRKRDGKLMKPYLQKSGYVAFCLNDGKWFGWHMGHRIVAETWLDREGYIQGKYVDHINTIRSDICNLRWVTPKENANNPITKQKKKMKELFKLQDGRLPKEQIDKITTFWDKQLKAVYDKN